MPHREAGGVTARRSGGRTLKLVAVAAVAATVLTACGGSDSADAVKRAQAQVEAKQRSLDDARGTLEEARQQFCAEAQTYIVALDRYGDALTATEPTVGDIKDAGADLEDPGDAAMSAAEGAVAANKAVAKAENDLAQAKADLKQAKYDANDDSASTPSSSASASPKASVAATPLAPAATVNRVKAAESQFEDAQEEITDQTPLKRATQEFNAAAVALEMSWLQLFADSGCLTGDQEKQAQATVEAYTTALQQALSEAGLYDGEIDGVYGPETVAAVQDVQKTHGLPVAGAVDKATQTAIASELAKVGGATATQATASTAAVQQTLKLAGFWNGPVDGAWTPALTTALEDFQKELGVPPTGAVDAATIAAFEKALVAVQTPQTSPAPATASPTSSAAPPRRRSPLRRPRPTTENTAPRRRR